MPQLNTQTPFFFSFETWHIAVDPKAEGRELERLGEPETLRLVSDLCALSASFLSYSLKEASPSPKELFCIEMELT
jgi:hypothetical protein